nr:serine hydrolase [Nocardioides convexus]
MAESDNAAGNWLLGLIGGPAAITRLARDLGDPVTALTRWEPDLNQWVPGATRDTTTPRAQGRNYAALLLGRALAPSDRRRLHAWMTASTTGAAALRAGLLPGWTIAEKTGSGDFGARNDVGLARTPDGAPVVISLPDPRPARHRCPARCRAGRRGPGVRAGVGVSAPRWGT